jgi:hypothetical protein
LLGKMPSLKINANICPQVHSQSLYDILKVENSPRPPVTHEPDEGMWPNVCRVDICPIFLLILTWIQGISHTFKPEIPLTLRRRKRIEAGAVIAHDRQTAIILWGRNPLPLQVVYYVTPLKLFNNLFLKMWDLWIWCLGHGCFLEMSPLIVLWPWRMCIG